MIFLSIFDRTGKISKAETMSRKCEVYNKVFSKEGDLQDMKELTVKTNLMNAMFAIRYFQSQDI